MGYEVGRTQLDKLEKLGLDATEARQAFVRLLTDRAGELSGRIDLALTRIDELSARMKDTPDDADVRVSLLAAHKSLDVNTSSMTIVLGIMEALELPAEVYREQLVTATRDLATGLLDTNVALRLLDRAMQSVTEWFVDKGPRILVRLLLFLGILLVARLVASLARKGVDRALGSSKFDISAPIFAKR